MEKYGFVYIWYDRKRKMYYVGCHWGSENDGYICSSNRMRDAYRRRPNDFKRRILATNIQDKTLLREEEDKWLKKAEKKKNIYYNIKFFTISPVWSWENKRFSLEHKENLGKVSRGKSWYTNGLENVFCFEKNKPANYFKGRTFSKSHKEAISKSQIGKQFSEERKQNISKNKLGKTFTEEHKKNMSYAIKNAWKLGKGKYKELKQ